jgi:ectoine hydroxylase-related dioxygenase (phytanoyl-CoA dioxygenase family)
MPPLTPTTPDSGRTDLELDDATRRAILADADTLVAEDRWLDAVDLLQRTPAVRDDPTLSRRLVQLRHSAFAHLHGSTPAAMWPPDVPDLFPEPGIPEIDATELAAPLVTSGIRRHGSIIVRNVLDEQDTAPLVEGIDRALDARDRWVSGEVSVDDTAPWFALFEPDDGYQPVNGPRNWISKGGGVWTADSPRMLFDFVDLLRRTPLPAVIEQHLGERPALSVQKSTLRRVPTDLNGADWHQDGAFLDKGAGLRTVNVWLSLSHCGVDAPGLELVPRRIDEILETGTRGAWFDWSVGPELVAEVAAATPPVHPVFAPGDVVLFDEFNLHRTFLDPAMTRPRYAIESWFFAPSKYPPHHAPVVI